MKKFLSILKYIDCVFVGIIALVFTFVEIRPLFAGDFLLMESSGLAFIKYLFRTLFFLLMAVNAAKVFYCVFKKRNIDLEGIIFNATIIVAAAMTFMFYEWFVAAVILVLNLLLFIIRIFNERQKQNQEVQQAQ